MIRMRSGLFVATALMVVGWAAAAAPEAATRGDEPEVELARPRQDRMPLSAPGEPGVQAQARRAPTVAPTPAPERKAAGCLLSSGPFALPEGAASVDWKLLNRADHPVEVEVTVFQLRIGEPARVLPPGSLRKLLAVGHEWHNANSVGHDRSFQPGLDYEVQVRRSDPRALPAISIWSSRGNSEIAGTRIGPEGFVPIGGDCRSRPNHD